MPTRRRRPRIPPALPAATLPPAHARAAHNHGTNLEAQHPAAASHRYGGEYMAPFSDFDAALPYVAEMPKTLAELLK